MMSVPPRRLRGCLLFVSALLALPAFAPAADPTADEIAARVNGTVISRQAVRAVVVALAAAQDTPPNSKQIEQLTRDALDSLIAFELLYQEGQRRGVTVTDGDIEAEIARTKAQFPTADAYSRALDQRGMSPDDVRRDTRKTLAVNRLLEQVAWHDIHISPEQVRRFYDENREQFKHPAEIRASHILLRTGADASAAERAQAKRQAEDLLAQIKSGTDFAELARRYSQDPATAAKGGDLGFLARGSMPPEFEQAAFALKRGGISNAVQTPYGLHLITVTDQRAAGYTPLAEVQADINAVLRDEERRRQQDRFAATLKNQARVEILPGLQPAEHPTP